MLRDDNMSATTKFNGIMYQNKLEDAGENIKIAKIHAEELQNILNTDIATKKDLELLETKMIIKLGSLVVGCTFIISVMIGVLGFILH
jgi:hypothetical protein